MVDYRVSRWEICKLGPPTLLSRLWLSTSKAHGAVALLALVDR